MNWNHFGAWADVAKELKRQGFHVDPLGDAQYPVWHAVKEYDDGGRLKWTVSIYAGTRPDGKATVTFTGSSPGGGMVQVKQYMRLPNFLDNIVDFREMCESFLESADEFMGEDE